jgi:Flp pilus assembly secretin CpaC
VIAVGATTTGRGTSVGLGEGVGEGVAISAIDHVWIARIISEPSLWQAVPQWASFTFATIVEAATSAKFTFVLAAA